MFPSPVQHLKHNSTPDQSCTQEVTMESSVGDYSISSNNSNGDSSSRSLFVAGRNKSKVNNNGALSFYFMDQEDYDANHLRRRQRRSRTVASSSSSAGRGVSFCTEVEVFDYPSCVDFSSKIIERTYYSPEEKALFRPQVYKRYSKCCKGECLRGLEVWNGRSGYLRGRHCKSARLAVMNEQELQRKQGTNEPPLLAERYSILARKSTVEARLVAQADELYVRQHVFGLPISQELIDAQRAVDESLELKACTCCNIDIASPTTTSSVSSSFSKGKKNINLVSSGKVSFPIMNKRFYTRKLPRNPRRGAASA